MVRSMAMSAQNEAVRWHRVFESLPVKQMVDLQPVPTRTAATSVAVPAQDFPSNQGPVRTLEILAIRPLSSSHAGNLLQKLSQTST